MVAVARFGGGKPDRTGLLYTMYTHICSLTALMNEDEKEEFYQEAKKEGF